MRIKTRGFLRKYVEQSDLSSDERQAHYNHWIGKGKAIPFEIELELTDLNNDECVLFLLSQVLSGIMEDIGNYDLNVFDNGYGKGDLLKKMESIIKYHKGEDTEVEK